MEKLRVFLKNRSKKSESGEYENEYENEYAVYGNLDKLDSEENNLKDVFSAFNDAIETGKVKIIELQMKLKEAEKKIEDLKVESASKTTVIQGLG